MVMIAMAGIGARSVRARNLKPGLFRNERLGSADPLLTILFEALWCMADREGRLEDRPLRICALAFPYRRRVTEKHVDAMLQWLNDEKFIARYMADGVRCIQVIEFLTHNNPHKKEAPSKIPPLTGVSHATSTGPAPDQPDARTEKGGTSPASSLNPSSLNPESSHSVREGGADAPRSLNGAMGKGRTRKVPADFTVTPEMRMWAAAECPGVDVDRETAKFRDHEFANPKSDWPATWRNWMRRAEPSRARGSDPSAPQQSLEEREAELRAQGLDPWALPGEPGYAGGVA